MKFNNRISTKLIYPAILFFFFIALYLHLQYQNSYLIHTEEDIRVSLEDVLFPHKGEDIYKAELVDGKIYALYKNMDYNGYYIFSVFEKNKIFKNRYQMIYAKENNPLDSKLNCEIYKTKHGDTLGFVYGVNLNKEDYNTVIALYPNEPNHYSAQYMNNISGDSINVIKTEKDADFKIYSFDSSQKQEEFLQSPEWSESTRVDWSHYK